MSKRMLVRTCLGALFAVTLWQPALAVDDSEQTPSLEFLEFLGDWESADGEWIDPLALEKSKLPEGQKSSPSPGKDHDNSDDNKGDKHD